MTFYVGTSGNDSYVGTSAADIFDMTQGGRDSVSGADSNDRFLFGDSLTKRDTIIGGDGADTVELDGDYSSGLNVENFMVMTVEFFRFAAGHTYDLTFDDTIFSGDATLTAEDLLAGDSLILDMSADLDTDLFIIGGAGDDVITGGQGGNDFRLDLGGADDITGGDGPDHFSMDAAWDAGDALDGGAGIDSVDLNGDYSGGLTILPGMRTGIESIELFGAFDYVLTADSALVDPGETLTITGILMAPGGHVEFDGSAINDGTFTLIGSPGDDIMTGADDNDTFISHGGADEFNGHNGADTFRMYDSLDAADSVDGKRDSDTLELDGDYSAGLVLGANTIQNIETIALSSGDSYDITTDDGNVKAGETLTVDGSLLFNTDVLTFIGTAELDGSFAMTGGLANDWLTGGELGDTLDGGGGSDRLSGFHGDDVLVGGDNGDKFNGGQGSDTYVIFSPDESTSTWYDRTLSFDTDFDVFDLGVTVTGIDATVSGGSLSTATFNADMASEIGAAELAAGHAVIFKPTSGDLAGDRFLIIDGNGVAGYQAFNDYVVLVNNARHMGGLATDNFI